MLSQNLRMRRSGMKQKNRTPGGHVDMLLAFDVGNTLHTLRPTRGHLSRAHGTTQHDGCLTGIYNSRSIGGGRTGRAWTARRRPLRLSEPAEPACTARTEFNFGERRVLVSAPWVPYCNLSHARTGENVTAATVVRQRL